LAKKKNTSKKKTAQPTQADAELVLKLYDLRREPELRRARQFVVSEFWPQSADEYLAILSEFGTQRNAWYRQATSYWEMAASLVVRGVVNREIFVDWSSEMWMIYGKALPYLKEVRERSGMPKMYGHMETVIQSTPGFEQRLAGLQKRLSDLGKRAAKAASASRG
jgi:hypothetical protein